MPSRPVQLGLLEGTDRRVGGFVPSVLGRTNADLIAAIAPLYLTGSVLDVTYGKGMWWRRFTPAPFGTHDLELDGVDFRQLPEDDGSWDAVCFDPPYIPRQGPNVAAGKEHHFRSAYGLVESRSEREIDTLIRSGLAECARVCRRWLLVKCSDYTNGKRLRLGHRLVLDWADDLPLRVHDLLILNGGPGPGAGHVDTPIRARRTHSYMLVFAKHSGRARPSSGASRSGRVSDVPTEPVRQSDTATTVSDGAPTVRRPCDANGCIVADRGAP